MPEVLSRDELLEALRDRGIEISAYTLEHYRRNGVIPRPIRLRHAGATRPVYPEWVPRLVEYMKRMQAQGYILAELRPILLAAGKRGDFLLEGFSGSVEEWDL